MRAAPMSTATALTLLALVGFGCDGAPGPVAPEPTTLTVSVSAAVQRFTALLQTTPLSIQVRDQNGAAVSTSVTVSTSNPGVVTVDGNGIVTARSNGQTVVRVSAGSAFADIGFTVAQEATDLEFSVQPSGALADTPLSPFEVSFLDALGSVVATENSTVELVAELPPANPAASGTLSVSATSGVARFTDVRLTAPGNGYRLRARSGGLSGLSAPFDVGAPPVPFQNFAAADFVLGQADFISGERNRGGSVGPLGLGGRASISSDGGLYYVSDSGNSRVLGYVGAPTSPGSTPDFVLGQPDFVTRTIPQQAINSDRTFLFPSRVLAAEGRLIVTDFNNNRVLIWNTLPRSTNVPADVVLGQPTFESEAGGTSRTAFRAPHGGVRGGRQDPHCRRPEPTRVDLEPVSHGERSTCRSRARTTGLHLGCEGLGRGPDA